MEQNQRTGRRERILIVDDSEMNRSILADMLLGEFDVTEAENGDEAIKLLRARHGEFSLVLLDIVMPGTDGFDVLAEMGKMNIIGELPVIMVSAETAAAQIERAYELGATDFIMRPFDASIVHRRVVNTILLYAKQKKLLSVIEDQICEKERNSNLMVDILSHIVEFRNGESGLHIQHVRTITEFLLRELVKKTDRYPLTETDISIIGMASALHDIGKIAIDDKILNKPGRLTAEEYAEMKAHSLIGAKMLEELVQFRDDPLVCRAIEICRWHHERYDGKGYPDGLKGDAIPISAQIVAIADVYDALTSERVYKPALSHERAKEMILAGECGAFNPLLLDCLAEEFKQIRTALLKESSEKARRREVRNFADAVLHSTGASASDRTLKLLDYERMKYNFFAELTEEVQFEYAVDGDMLKLSPRGAKKFGVETEIFRPAADPRLKGQLGKVLERVREGLKGTSPERPECRFECKLTLGGEMRWYDFIMRAIWSDDLPPRVTSVIGKIVDVNDTHNTIVSLKESVLRDPLTGLLNRAGVAEEIDRKLSRYPEHKFAVVLFDIDRFKDANDTYGHLFGDRVLDDLANRLIHATRADDLCARVGGDEFLIVFEYDTDIGPIIARVFKALCGKVEDFELTVSMGVCEMTRKDQPYKELFRKADIALYVSKNTGRACYHFYDESMEGSAVAAEISETEERRRV